MFCIKTSTNEGGGSFPVYLNVYDLTPLNGYAYWLGVGVFHSGVQVHGTEYCYGAHEGSSTGIFAELPRQEEGFFLRKTVKVGATDMSPGEVRALMDSMGKEYRGNLYNLMTRNCNHFSNDVCVRLTGNSIPHWINRLAYIGLFFNCFFPSNLKSTKVSHIGSEDEDKQKMKSEAASPTRGVSGHGRNRSRNGLSRLQLLI